MFKLITNFNERANFDASELASAGSGIDTSAITDAAQAGAAAAIDIAVASIEGGVILNTGKAAESMAKKI